jgi:hypothetical protein
MLFSECVSHRVVQDNCIESFSQSNSSFYGQGNIEEWCFDPLRRGKNTMIILFSPPDGVGGTGGLLSVPVAEIFAKQAHE